MLYEFPLKIRIRIVLSVKWMQKQSFRSKNRMADNYTKIHDTKEKKKKEGQY